MTTLPENVERYLAGLPKDPVPPAWRWQTAAWKTLVLLAQLAGSSLWVLASMAPDSAFRDLLLSAGWPPEIVATAAPIILGAIRFLGNKRRVEAVR